MLTASVPSFAKINLGLNIGPPRADGFHELRTIYQTIALHDVIRVGVQRGSGIEIRCKDPRVPADESNTCYRVVERVMRTLRGRGKVVIWIEKSLPIQGGLGAASSNAAATMLALERELDTALSAEEQLRIAAEVGSDVPLFLVGGDGAGHSTGGQEVYALQGPLLPFIPWWSRLRLGFRLPQAFADWDALVAREAELTHAGARRYNKTVRQRGVHVAEQGFPIYRSCFPPRGAGDRSRDTASRPRPSWDRKRLWNERVVFPEHPSCVRRNVCWNARARATRLCPVPVQRCTGCLLRRKQPRRRLSG